jgi:hypothetical protein
VTLPHLPHQYMISFNRHANNSIPREELIKAVAGLVDPSFKVSSWKDC